MDEFNPYAAPKAEVITQHTEAETIRRKHINHEASIKSVGCLYGVMAIAMVIILITIGSSLVSESLWAVGLILGLGLLAAAVARGLRNLRRWAAVLAAVWSGILIILGIPDLPQSSIPMVISAYVLWLMVSPKGLFVTSLEYQIVIAQTPHVKRRTSVLVWVLLILLLAILSIGIYSAMSTR